MIIVFNCPNCGAILRMKEQYGGQRGRCPHCQGAITVPAIESDAGMDLIPLDGPPPASAAVPAAPPAAAAAPAEPAPFSIESRLRSLGVPSLRESGASAIKRSDTGDSNIGLAPVDDRPASAAAKAAAAAPAPAPTPPRPASGPDENFALAPLDEAAIKSSTRAPANAAGENGSAVAAGAVSDSKADHRLTVVCDGCGARMQAPPVAAGRQVACPRCKKKLRVPGAADPSASKSSTSDARSPQDTPSSSSRDLDIAMLDELETAGPAAAAETTAAALRAPSAKGKARALGASKANTLLGLPPLAAYGAAAGLTVLIAGLAIVYVATKPAATNKTAPPIVAQRPGGGTPAPRPAAPKTTPSAASNGGAAAPPNPFAPEPAAPNPAPTPTATTPGVTPTPTATDPVTPVPATPGPMPTAPATGQRVEWRGRIPVVRMTTRRYKSEPKPEDIGDGSGVEVPLLTVPSIEPRPPDPKPDEVKALVKVAGQTLKTQQRILGQLKQMVNVSVIKQLAPEWADLTAQGLEQIRQDSRLHGVDLPSSDSMDRLQAKLDEEPTVLQSQAEIERLAQVPGAIEALEAALRQRAAREPVGALAATLKEARP